MTKQINTLITIPAALRRAGYKALLQGEAFNVAGETAAVEEAAALLQTTKPDLLLAECPEPDSDAFELLTAFKASHPDLKIIVFADGIGAHAAHQLCQAGIDGILETDIAPEALMGYINLVLLGETVIHPGVGLVAPRMAASGPSGKDVGKMSERELIVVQHLANGLSNKEIARLLGIVDGTVKIHVRNVQRKLKLKNRTQIAVWAVEHGLQDMPMAA